jgi:hypothetical protein
MRRTALVLGFCAACGGGDTAPAADAPAADAEPDAPPPLDAPTDAAPDTTRPNVVFVTADRRMGNLGGLAGADAMCADEATAAGLPGEFRAFVSTSTVDARDRFAGSRGWVAVDGTPILDTMDALLAQQRVFNPIMISADGEEHAPFHVLTGSNTQGRKVPGAMCGDWTDNLSEGRVGTRFFAGTRLISDETYSCVNGGCVYCFEVGHAFTVVPDAVAGDRRIGFVSAARRSAPGLAHLDGICAAEASAAGLPGSFLAAVATSTASIASRFTADARPWTRPDGTLVAAGDALLIETDFFRSFFNQQADGTYTRATTVSGVGATPTMAGTVERTCNDWQQVTAAGGTTMLLGAPASARSMWGYLGDIPCNTPLSVLCLQE